LILTKADDKDVTKESYEGPFYTTQLGIHNTIHATDNTWPSPIGNVNWFGEGATPTSVGVSVSSTTYRLVGSLLNSDVGKVLDIDKALQDKIDAFNKEHPKEEPKKTTPTTVSPSSN
jgi:hypothetical protein